MDRDEVRRIATLARLEIPESGMERMATELSAVLEFVAALGKLDLSGLDPMTFAPEDAPLRQDALDERCLGAEAALAGAPERDDHYFLVPPIVENVNP